MNEYISVSKITYEIENVHVQLSFLEPSKQREKIERVIGEAEKFPSFSKQLEYLDSFYDENGVSGAAFKHTTTGEIIIGYTGSNAPSIFELVKDWTNNVSGAFGMSGYCLPACRFYEKIAEQYGEDIVLTGHSQGGGIAQYVALTYNVSKTVVYNAAPLYTQLSIGDDEQLASYSTKGKQAIDEKIELFTGEVIRFTSEEDVLNASVRFIGGKYIGIEYHLSDTGYHMIDDFFKNPGALYTMEMVLLSTLSYDSESIWDEYKLDRYEVMRCMEQPKNLFSNTSVFSDRIELNTHVLQELNRNLKRRIQEDIKDIEHLIRKSIDQNDGTLTQFDVRKQRLIERVRECLKQMGFPRLLVELQSAIAIFFKHQYVLEQGMMPMTLLLPVTTANQEIWIDGIPFNEAVYTGLLREVQTACATMLEYVHLSQRASHSHVQEDIAHQRLLHSTEETVPFYPPVQQVFEGDGKRSGKRDGIADALYEVLPVMYNNTKEIEKSLFATVRWLDQMIEQFDRTDKEMAHLLKNGMPIYDVHRFKTLEGYEAHLARVDILDDVKHIVHALEKQVEKNARRYLQQLEYVCTQQLKNGEEQLKRGVYERARLEKRVKQVVRTYESRVTVRERAEESDAIGWTSIMKMEQMYPSHVRGVLYGLQYELLQQTKDVEEVILSSQQLRKNIKQLLQPLQSAIEEAIYKMQDMDRMLLYQQLVIRVAKRMLLELEYVLNVLEMERFISLAIEALKMQLKQNCRLLREYIRLISDCFGNHAMESYQTREHRR